MSLQVTGELRLLSGLMSSLACADSRVGMHFSLHLITLMSGSVR
jgi:hypothetical protein